MNDILNFIESGNIFDIGLGDSIEEVESKLGAPEDILHNGDLELHKFFSLEVTFRTREICMISIQVYDDMIYYPETFKSKEISFKYLIDDFTALLNEKNRYWFVCGESSQDEFVAIKTSSDVVVFFELPHRGITRIQMGRVV